ncbi:hypothetical protein CO101_02575 [Candidatus Berkelbacteria bacterium CG_4_9_14_3_um_filter_39_23]|uniref:Uncharacterized protein n=2 Tax=Candidatus Berkelbacteria TaxID=1618330 RepID=A0A2M7CIZ7_9BACT|nr:MAG: hypothetical protein AUK14_00425 [Candidatus Berkelbacteria bacterium CG2_30_39_44]PIR27753.1 MAG: hypothetical protein COV39_02835 [Candidatus Berkelbacteria bacterium CG11_big_fil_rev_8_21_14_0_20_40_23]PIV25623.1 MAG: hypothetical protein COS38_00605 [Candidatus Berkelbacteria bacterium CG03_land_8_20_14_0_80_40_36]PJB51261.1 MAG: hypothetical protein CO101_02575 [Candidatus Berkelbacteria bacterium CG_4_9_14_3_um_filter_39_23]
MCEPILNETPTDCRALRGRNRTLGRAKRKGVGEGIRSTTLRTSFLPALVFATSFFATAISYFALRNTPPRRKLCLPRPPVRAQQVFTPFYNVA